MAGMTGIVLALFFPACVGIMAQAIQSQGSGRLLAVSLLLLCLDQARMAVVDLTQAAAARTQGYDPRVERFYWVTVSTIGLELIGFYGAAAWLGLGTIGVLLSQVWFHLLAGVQLLPGAEGKVRVQEFGIRPRLPILAADLVGIALVSLWRVAVWSQVAIAILFSLFLAYGLAKYGPVLFKRHS
jgi:hypothetical protein